MSSIWVISILEFICVNEAPLVFVFVICFEELTRERTLNSLTIGGITPILGIEMICASYSRRVLANSIAGH